MSDVSDLRDALEAEREAVESILGKLEREQVAGELDEERLQLAERLNPLVASMRSALYRHHAQPLAANLDPGGTSDIVPGPESTRISNTWNTLNYSLNELEADISHQQKQAEDERTERRESAEASNSTARTSIWASAAVAIATAWFGHVSCSGVLPPATVVEGTLSIVPNTEVAVVSIDCQPTLDGVFAAAGDATWSVTVLPRVDRPLRLYCRARAGGHVGAAVTVDVPAGVTRGAALPDMLLDLEPPKPSPVPSGTGDATASDPVVP